MIVFPSIILLIPAAINRSVVLEGPILAPAELPPSPKINYTSTPPSDKRKSIVLGVIRVMIDISVEAVWDPTEDVLSLSLS